LVCCAFFHILSVASAGLEKEQPPEAVADASSEAQESVEPDDNTYKAVDLSELFGKGKQYSVFG